MLTTERLILRARHAADNDNILAHCDNPLVRQSASPEYLAPLGPRFLENFTGAIDKALLFVVIESKDTAEFIGLAQLACSNPKNQDAEFGISIGPKFWNKGYGTEVTRFLVDHAFRWLNMHRVSLSVFGGNTAAINLYRRM